MNVFIQPLGNHRTPLAYLYLSSVSETNWVEGYQQIYIFSLPLTKCNDFKNNMGKLEEPQSDISTFTKSAPTSIVQHVYYNLSFGLNRLNLGTHVFRQHLKATVQNSEQDIRDIIFFLVFSNQNKILPIQVWLEKSK